MSAERESTVPAASPIAAPLLEWYARAGRHDLPWQTERTPYRVWVSEIMLQQTQVAAVRPYYARFMRRFPDLAALAAAPVDEVLHLWSGLGYYARACNLHRAAKLIRAQHGGAFPRSFAAVAELPGIGRSTAGAILALAHGERHPILDGNVRRVLARYFGLSGDLTTAAAVQRLWALSERCTPHERLGEYTQAIMDLGATACVRARPLCAACPLAGGCSARRSGREREIPAPRVARARRARRVFMVVARRADGSVRLERRPENGVWGGLWCLPEFGSARAARAYVNDTLAARGARLQRLSAVEHAFTHFDLVIHPLLVACAGRAPAVEEGATLWYNGRAPARIGLPAPIAALLKPLACAAQPEDRPPAPQPGA